MRDFRGKRDNPDFNEWVYGVPVYGGIKIFQTRPSGIPVSVYPDTVGQCTGIMGDFIQGEPKAGDNILRSFIYEGDIVEAVLTEGTHIGFSWGRHVVVFDRGAFCLKSRRGEITPMCNYSANVKFKVLGNIWDNPELMEGQGNA